MEHRWNTRKSLGCRVALYLPRRGTAIGRMRDIGLGGMFIETTDVVLGPHMPLHVAFTLDDGNRESVFRLHAMVVRRTPAGAGIMFLETADPVLDALRRVLYAPDTAPEHWTAPVAGSGISAGPSPRAAVH